MCPRSAVAYTLSLALAVVLLEEPKWAMSLSALPRLNVESEVRISDWNLSYSALLKFPRLSSITSETSWATNSHVMHLYI